ncbi:MAG: AlpA family transcriptional regulator [Methylococcales bacterium]|jgi:prophage regulatory protein|nr:AlpA family transcriptional regulator [Methylococcales bacterium]
MKFLKLQAVMSITGLSRSSIYLAISEGRFPKQIPLGARSVAWLEAEIEGWVKSRIAQRGAI